MPSLEPKKAECIVAEPTMAIANEFKPTRKRLASDCMLDQTLAAAGQSQV
jgi:hypothetical protein